MDFVGILAGLCLLIWLAYRSWSVLLLAPATALLAALLAGEPLLAHWTETFMGSAAIAGIASAALAFVAVIALGTMLGSF